MKFTFDYEETLTRRVRINADSIEQAITELKRRIDDEEIVLNAEDFAGGKISIPLGDNWLELDKDGTPIKELDYYDLIIDYW